MGWFKEILMKLYLVDRPVASRKGPDRRKGPRRWSGQAHPAKDPRRKKDRRKGPRRG
jgi:hypothetical protein